LLAKHVHVCLELEKSLKSQENASYYIKYANELWTSIYFLSGKITNNARTTLLNTKNSSYKVLLEAVTAIYFLENTTLEKIFNEFTQKRAVFIFFLILLFLKLDLSRLIFLISLSRC
jgi:hypothetical protein